MFVAVNYLQILVLYKINNLNHFYPNILTLLLANVIKYSIKFIINLSFEIYRTHISCKLLNLYKFNIQFHSPSIKFAFPYNYRCTS